MDVNTYFGYIVININRNNPITIYYLLYIVIGLFTLKGVIISKIQSYKVNIKIY